MRRQVRGGRMRQATVRRRQICGNRCGDRYAVTGSRRQDAAGDGSRAAGIRKAVDRVVNIHVYKTLLVYILYVYIYCILYVLYEILLSKLARAILMQGLLRHLAVANRVLLSNQHLAVALRL